MEDNGLEPMTFWLPAREAASQNAIIQAFSGPDTFAYLRSYLDCRQPQTTEDNVRQDIGTILQSLLKTTGWGNDNNIQRQTNSTTAGESEGAGRLSMLEAVKMLVAMAPEERAALVALIKALG